MYMAQSIKKMFPALALIPAGVPFCVIFNQSLIHSESKRTIVAAATHHGTIFTLYWNSYCYSIRYFMLYSSLQRIIAYSTILCCIDILVPKLIQWPYYAVYGLSVQVSYVYYSSYSAWDSTTLMLYVHVLPQAPPSEMHTALAEYKSHTL